MPACEWMSLYYRAILKKIPFHVLQIIYSVNINRPFFVGCDGNVIKWLKSLLKRTVVNQSWQIDWLTRLPWSWFAELHKLDCICGKCCWFFKTSNHVGEKKFNVNICRRTAKIHGAQDKLSVGVSLSSRMSRRYNRWRILVSTFHDPGNQKWEDMTESLLTSQLTI